MRDGRIHLRVAKNSLDDPGYGAMLMDMETEESVRLMPTRADSGGIHLEPSPEMPLPRFSPTRGPQRRGGLPGEIILAVPPTIAVLGALFAIEHLTGQHLLFASLASSAFLIYRDPTNPMNNLRVMVAAHILAVVIGTAPALLLGAGYRAAAVALILAIVLLVTLNIVHPPALSTALGFAFYAHQTDTIPLFLLAVGMLVALVILERLALLTLHRPERIGALARP